MTVFKPGQLSYIALTVKKMCTKTLTLLYFFPGNYKDCGYNKKDPNTKSLTIAGYIMAGLTCVCIVPFIIVFIKWKWQDRMLRYRHHDQTDLIQTDRWY